jgi:hypothetical protein
MTAAPGPVSGYQYFLLYGAGSWTSPAAGIGHAVCSGPLGPLYQGDIQFAVAHDGNQRERSCRSVGSELLRLRLVQLLPGYPAACLSRVVLPARDHLQSAHRLRARGRRAGPVDQHRLMSRATTCTRPDAGISRRAR